MEHRLITGGFEFLPFARSHITKLKKLGLPYADQSYEVGGVSIKVRIEPGHEYIRIEGGIELISGAVRGGEIVTTPATDTEAAYSVLRAFKPTPNAWQYPLRKNDSVPTSAFSDMRRLNRVKPPYDNQYAALSPSSYSGLMAKVVAVLMARGVPVKYYYNWDTCHGITLDSDGRPWLVEISVNSGVVAMRLPLDTGDKKSKVDAEREIIALLGGVPRGDPFPVAESLDSAIDAGKVVRLATVKSMEGYFKKSYMDNEIGWSFNDTGNEAQNVCVATDKTGKVTSYLYRLTISIVISEFAPPSGAATLTLMEQGDLYAHALFGGIPFALTDGFTVPCKVLGYYEDDVFGSAPLLAIFSDGAFDVIRYENTARSGTTVTVPDFGEGPPPPVFDQYIGHTGGRRVFSSLVSSGDHSSATHAHFEKIMSYGVGNAYRETRYAPHTGFMFATKGNRDGYGAAPKLAGRDLRVSYVGWYYTGNPMPGFDWAWGGAVTYNNDDSNYTEVDHGYGHDLGYQSDTVYFAAGDFWFRSKNIYGFSRAVCTIYSRHSPPVKLAEANKVGTYVANNTDFRFNVFGPTPHYAFITREYWDPYDEYQNFTLIHHENCGVTHLGGDMVAGDFPIVLGRKYNFIGYIK